jgi:hypothetical protein
VSDNVISETEYAVYGALLAALVDPERKCNLRPLLTLTQGPVVVCRHVNLVSTVDPGFGEVRHRRGLADLVAKSFARPNGRWLSLPSTIEHALPTQVPHVVGEDRGDAMQPHGIVFLSRVGFDPQQGVAVVHVTVRAMALCGRSGFATLTREAAGWQLEREYVTGIA